jgi:hypothetical protein
MKTSKRHNKPKRRQTFRIKNDKKHPILRKTCKRNNNRKRSTLKKGKLNGGFFGWFRRKIHPEPIPSEPIPKLSDLKEFDDPKIPTPGLGMTVEYEPYKIPPYIIQKTDTDSMKTDSDIEKDTHTRDIPGYVHLDRETLANNNSLSNLSNWRRYVGSVSDKINIRSLPKCKENFLTSKNINSEYNSIRMYNVFAKILNNNKGLAFDISEYYNDNCEFFKKVVQVWIKHNRTIKKMSHIWISNDSETAVFDLYLVLVGIIIIEEDKSLFKLITYILDRRNIDDDLFELNNLLEECYLYRLGTLNQPQQGYEDVVSRYEEDWRL